ncbi:MAG: heavy metal translocating P-type ATPase, partial [Bacteroidia bacterium]|nr:heavy metal translocating P-type ATPase [Bacteroidia bacterium]
MESDLVSKQFPVKGMSCASCANSIETVLSGLAGVSSVSVNFATQSVLIQYHSQYINPEILRAEVQKIGFDLLIQSQDPNPTTAELKERQKQFWLALPFSIPVIVLGMFFMDWKWTPYLSLLFSLPVILFSGKNFYVHAFQQVRRRIFGMDTLVAISTLVAILYSISATVAKEWWHSFGIHPHIYYESAVSIILFLSLGKWLEAKAKYRAASSIRELASLLPNTARVLENSEEKEIPLSEVLPSMQVRIRPGERVPCDGQVIEGHSFVEESVITGESLPVEKTPGQLVYAGTINGNGMLLIQTTSSGLESVFAKIIQSVETALASKAPVQALADKMTAKFVPIVLLISVLTMFAWLFWGGIQLLPKAILATISVLVIACPCALGLATPTALIVGLGLAAKNKLLIRNATSLESASKINLLCLDKTGTITEGKPKVIFEKWFSQSVELAIQQLVALEACSEHPFAGAILAHFQEYSSAALALKPDWFVNHPGHGIEGMIAGKRLLAGKLEWVLTEFPTYQAQLSNFLKSQTNIASWVVFASDDELLGIFGIEDTLKPEAGTVIPTIQSIGIKVVMLSGDQESTAKAIAKQAGIEEVYFRLLPAQKAQKIREWKQNGYFVAMVGDGINDSEALAEADFSIAMGKGTEIAQQIA